jgi:hypothetical protein
MKRTALFVAVLIAGATFAFAQANRETAPAKNDAKLDKIIEQNEQILKQQQEILKQLEEVKTQLSALRRRSS